MSAITNATTPEAVLDTLNAWQQEHPVVGDPGETTSAWADFVQGLDGYHEFATLAVDPKQRGDRLVVQFSGDRQVLFRFDNRRAEWFIAQAKRGNTTTVSEDSQARTRELSRRTDITPTLREVRIKKVSVHSLLLVDPLWDGVDRELSSGWAFDISAKGRRLAERLKAAIEAGVVLYDIEVHEDVNGDTYVSARSRVMAKYADADLKKLGF